MMIVDTLEFQTICQKSSRVLLSGPWVAMKARSLPGIDPLIHEALIYELPDFFEKFSSVSVTIDVSNGII